MTDVESAARHRALEKLTPGCWWRGKFDTGLIWVRVDVVMETENVITGHRFVRLYGSDPNETGDRRHVEHVNLRGTSVLSLTETQAKRYGLSAPDEVTS